MLHLAEVLNKLGHSQAQSVLLRLAKTDARLAAALKQVMFRFDDLALLRDRSVPVLFAALPRTTWLLAMRAASEAVRAKLLGNMSGRARSMFLDDLGAAPKQRRSDVEKAQAEVVRTALKLEAAGKVFIDRPGAPDVYV